MMHDYILDLNCYVSTFPNTFRFDAYVANLRLPLKLLKNKQTNKTQQKWVDFSLLSDFCHVDLGNVMNWINKFRCCHSTSWNQIQENKSNPFPASNFLETVVAGNSKG